MYEDLINNLRIAAIHNHCEDCAIHTYTGCAAYDGGLKNACTFWTATNVIRNLADENKKLKERLSGVRENY